MGIATAPQNTQDPATGLWYQVVDMSSRTDKLARVVRSNSSHGLCAILLAASEMEATSTSGP